jgi:hypothetical protein
MDKDIEKMNEYKKLFEMLEKMKPQENKLIKDTLKEYGYNTTDKTGKEIRLYELQNDILKTFNLKTIDF